VGWKRNGRPLSVEWTNSGERIESQVEARFLARQVSVSEFVLTITSVQPATDNNSSFACLYRKRADTTEGEWTESNVATLFVQGESHVRMEVDLAPPIDDLAAKHPHNLRQNHTTQLKEPRRPVGSLGETLADLYEIARPSLIMLGLLSLVGLLVALQLVCLRRRSRLNRYTKHQYTGTGGSGTSGGLSCAEAGSADRNPMLSSLGGASKKYRSYRDHLRKVAAASDVLGNDFADGYFGQRRPQQQERRFCSTEQHDPFHINSALPNLYNQSLAAREQARSLLQSSEHMRSLSNLSYGQKQHANSLALRFANQNGSHLNLPLTFAFGGQRDQALAANGFADNMAQLTPSALWPQQHRTAGQTQREKQNNDEHYQLVSCASNSTSSSSPLAGGTSGSNYNSTPATTTTTTAAFRDSIQQESGGRRHQLALDNGASLNHYSTIEANEGEEEEEEDRYEELEPSQAGAARGLRAQSHPDGQRKPQVSTFMVDNQSQPLLLLQQQQKQTEGPNQQRASLRCSLNSTSSTSNSNASSPACPDSSATAGSLLANLAANAKRSTSERSRALKPETRSNYQDQLSPYAVSSICNPVGQQQPPPPVSSEALRALQEQFDINQLMMLEDSGSVVFDAPPPPPLPPPPPPPSQAQGQPAREPNRSQPSRKLKHDRK